MPSNIEFYADLQAAVEPLGTRLYSGHAPCALRKKQRGKKMLLTAPTDYIIIFFLYYTKHDLSAFACANTHM